MRVSPLAFAKVHCSLVDDSGVAFWTKRVAMLKSYRSEEVSGTTKNLLRARVVIDSVSSCGVRGVKYSARRGKVAPRASRL